MHAYMAREVDHPRRDRITGPIDRPNIRERDYHVKVRTGLHEQHCILCYARHAPIVVPQVPVYDSGQGRLDRQDRSVPNEAGALSPCPAYAPLSP